MTAQIPNWTTVPPPAETPPKKKRKTGRIVAGSIGLVIGIFVVAGIASSGGGSDPVTPAPAQSQPKQSSERADLATFHLDDRSVSGMSDVWVKWTVVNHSSKTSDYVIKWEALDPQTHTRVANGEEYTYNVRSGQTAKDAMPTTLTTGNATVNITSFDRTESY